MAKIAWIKEFGKRVYLTFKLWRMALISTLVLSIILGTNLLDLILGINVLSLLPWTMRWTFVLVYVLFMEIMVLGIARLMIGSAGQIISNAFYNRKHKPEKHYFPSMKKITKNMGMKYDKPICITDNPSIKSPFTNFFSRQIWFPRSLWERFHRTENEATIGHEAAHIKYGRRFIGELLLVTTTTIVFAQLLALSATILMMFLIAELAFMMLLLSPILQRNEFRADWEGAKATSPEALISVLEYFKARSKRDDSSITHPSLQARIDRLMRLLESD